MSREWKQGDVALVGGDVAVYLATTKRWLTSRGWKVDTLDPKPLVVIDPEDREQVERVRAAFRTLDCLPGDKTEDWQAALRSLLAPEKPAEPRGLGAVVEDADGVQWVRLEWMATKPWHSADEFKRYHDYSTITAVKVLSEGVS